MDVGAAQQGLQVMIVLLVEAPLLFGLGYLASLSLVALYRTTFGNREGESRWTHVFGHALLLNCAITVEWLVLLIVLPLLAATRTMLDQTPAPPVVDGSSFAAYAMKAYWYSWLLLLAMILMAVVTGLLRLVLTVTANALARRIGSKGK